MRSLRPHCPLLVLCCTVVHPVIGWSHAVQLQGPAVQHSVRRVSVAVHVAAVPLPRDLRWGVASGVAGEYDDVTEHGCGVAWANNDHGLWKIWNNLVMKLF